MWTRSWGLRLLVVLLAGLLSAATLVVCVLAGVFFYFNAQVPDIGDVAELQFNAPLRIYSADHELIGKYGTQRRLPLDYEQIPKQVANAFVSAEDDRFWDHPGVDYQGLARAVLNLVTTGSKSQGGSTITMQLARNLYLSRTKTYSRKIKEMILAMRLESKLSKDKILELYLNKIYLGEHAYGVGAAAQVYFGKPLDQLSLAQTAMLAGLPKAPSAYNPIVNPTRAGQRRNYVLERMHVLGYIDDAAWKKASQAPITAGRGNDNKEKVRLQAGYVAQMVRKSMVKRYGDKAYTGGYTVITTLRSKRQSAAVDAVRKDLLAYDARHAWHGPEKTLEASVVADPQALQAALEGMQTRAGLVPAVVLSTAGQNIRLATEKQGEVTVGKAMNPWLRGNERAASMVKRGDVVRLLKRDSGQKPGDNREPWRLAEIPAVQGSLVAMDPHDGAIEALVGGFDFSLSQFNRAVQSRRQPGSAFKPFLYSAALAHGFTAATLVNDAPIVYTPTGQDTWRPHNYSRSLNGQVRLREGLVHSLNLVSIRILRRIGINTAVQYISHMGLPVEQMPRNLTLALGAAAFSPLQMAAGFSVFANEGFKVKPYFIKQVSNGRGDVVFQAQPQVACDEVADCQALQATAGDPSSARLAPRVLAPDNAYIVGDMMRDVILSGTGRAALKLKRKDLSGKTGTTNEQVDAWFSGFNANLVAVSWVGFDEPRSLGRYETGAHAALPMWIDFMGSALHGKPEALPPKPADIETVMINPKTGQRELHGGGIPEIFRQGHAPSVYEAEHSGRRGASNEVKQIF